MELILGATSARLLEPEDLTSFAVVLEEDVAPGPEALAEVAPRISSTRARPSR